MSPVFRFVELTPTGWKETDVRSIADFQIARPGVDIVGLCERRGIRAELFGQPYLSSFAGPMWGGTTKDGAPIVRYESQDANDRLSA